MRVNGRVYETCAALFARALDLYHSALEVRVPEDRFVIEMAPVPTATAQSAASSPKAPSEVVPWDACASSATRYGAGSTA